MTQVVPESRLKLIVTRTAPGFGEIEPDKVREEPMVTEFGVKVREVTVEGLVKVVSVVGVLVLVIV